MKKSLILGAVAAAALTCGTASFADSDGLALQTQPDRLPGFYGSSPILHRAAPCRFDSTQYDNASRQILCPRIVGS